MARKPCSHSPWKKKERTQTLCTIGREVTNELTSYLWLTDRVVESLKKENDADAAKNSHVKEDYRSLLPNSLHRTWMGEGLMQIIMFEYALPARPTKKTENGQGNRDGEWKFCPGKDRKNLQSKLVDYSPKQDNQKQRTLKHRNKPNGSKSTNHKSKTMAFWTVSANVCFLRDPLRWLTEQKNPKFLRSLQNAQRDATNLVVKLTETCATF